jgi:hypothetical protein
VAAGGAVEPGKVRRAVGRANPPLPSATASSRPLGSFARLLKVHRPGPWNRFSGKVSRISMIFDLKHPPEKLPLTIRVVTG